MQLRKIVNYLHTLYPLEKKEIWDPSGFSVKFNLSEKFKGAIVALDLTDDVLTKALELDANLIITHHPFKFQKTWDDEFNVAPYKKEILEILKAKRINVLALHTNFDNSSFGTSKRIVEELGLIDYLFEDENPYGAVIKGHNLNFYDLVKLIKSKLNLNALRTNIKNQNFELDKVAFLSGSGANVEVNNYTLNNFSLIVTSDIKWSDWVNYQQIKAPLLEIPHLDEQVFTRVIKNDLLTFKTKEKVSVKEVLLEEIYFNL
ncbi:Nif3-like dinuclear metal center hexameric protein [Mycoplasmopsis columbina]|uniref:Nif3-like dinuclear metal center hexameric protein n=1 Tax=Mycoplasmopsis columbina TaxID=114881 RepID=UPI0004A7711F|nr:Nif3-like dinuclear metal center hexameric protein [Mycoplasmopsis columbina]VEU76866.1 Uncharacterized protein conserved in bacteria [Mycoplasmopsis columbina]